MASGSPPSLRILIATGDAVAGRLMAEQVRRAGHHPVLAADGPDVLEWFEREVDHPHSLDLAILDAALPGYPGVALAACARNNALSLPLLLVEGERARLSSEWLGRLGLLGIMPMPVDGDAFAALLDDITRPRLARGTNAGFGPSYP